MSARVGLILAAGRERSVLRGHPWLFSGAVARVEGAPASGEAVLIRAQDGRALAVAAYAPESRIRARLWDLDPQTRVDAAFVRERVARAIAARPPAWRGGGPVCGRLVNAESDGLPGLVVDRYAGFLVCQLHAAGVERWREAIVDALAETLPALAVYERSDAAARAREGLPPAGGVLRGDAPPELVEVEEGGRRYAVDLRYGHKTGFYLDQRVNRDRFAAYAAGREVLNAFAYTGAFTVAALAGGATRVTNIESSAPALALARRNLALNGQAPDRVEDIEGDAFEQLRRLRDARRSFDLVVLDPPRFAESRGQVERAARGYKDINLLAIKLLRPGGLLFTFSCSSGVERALFQKIVADAAVDARRELQILEWLSQAPDHPVRLSFPEGMYLKGLVCRVG